MEAMIRTEYLGKVGRWMVEIAKEDEWFWCLTFSVSVKFFRWNLVLFYLTVRENVMYFNCNEIGVLKEKGGKKWRQFGCLRF